MRRRRVPVSYRGSVLESYSGQARRAVSLATAESRRLNHPHVGTEHLLLGLLADEHASTAHTLRDAGATLNAARHKVMEVAGAGTDEPPLGELPFTPRAQRALERAGRFCRQAREPEVRTEHLLLGVLDVEGLACQVLRGLDVDLGRLQDALVDRPSEPASTSGPDTPEPAAAQPSAEEGPAAATLPQPRCPACSAKLVDTLAVARTAARHDDGGATTQVRVVYCAACATALGALPAHD